MDEDDVGPGELIATRDPGVDVRAVVDEQLEVEPRRQPARVAIAAGGRVDAPEPAPEREVRGLDRVEQERPVGPSILDEQEGGVAFELGQAERRIEATDDRLEQVARDDRRVLDLAARQVRGVAGQVGDDEEPGLGCRCHGRHATPWSRSNVNPSRELLRNEPGRSARGGTP